MRARRPALNQSFGQKFWVDPNACFLSFYRVDAMAKVDKKQSKSAAKGADIAKPKPASTKDILAKAKKAPVDAVCFEIVFFFCLAKSCFLFIINRSPSPNLRLRYLKRLSLKKNMWQMGRYVQSIKISLRGLISNQIASVKACQGIFFR